MKNLFFALLMLEFSALAIAQAASSGPATAQPTSSQREPFAPDTMLMAELTTSVDAGKSRPGDVITAKLRGDTWGATQNLLPSGSTLIGHVIEARGHSKEDPQSQLSISFDKARIKDGTEIPLNLVVDHFEVPLPIQMVKTSGDAPLVPSMNGTGRTANSPPKHRGNPAQPHPSAWEQEISPTAKIAGPSGIPEIELTSMQQDFGNVTVLTSNRRQIKLDKHDLVYLRIVVPEKQATAK